MKYSILICTLALTLSACSKTSHDELSSSSSTPIIPKALSGPVAPDINVGTATQVVLNNGAEVTLQNINGTLFLEVEGTFEREAYNKIRLSNSTAAFEQEINNVFKTLGPTKAIPMTSVAEAGYFNFLLPYQADVMSAVAKLKFDRKIILNPVVTDSESLRNIKALRTAVGDTIEPTHGAIKNFSGLEQLGTSEFIKLAQSKIGPESKVNGSSVNIGITDTGITYNHPSFLSANGKKSRITYMKDFTGEGRVYFNPASAFTVTAPADGSSDTLKITAEVIVTPKLPIPPTADSFSSEEATIKVSPKLKALLTAPNASGAKLGILDESNFSGDGEIIDLNSNGKYFDRLFVIFVPGATQNENAVYFDSTGTGDFRNVLPLRNFNTSGDLTAVSAEKIGFDLHPEKIPTLTGSSAITVQSASIVGFDPGNHGSHVAGIAAGRRTIHNDDVETLARGVAPSANILMSRVCANNGGCSATKAFVDLAVFGGAEVINMSLGGLSPFNDGYGVQETLINRLTQTRNVLFVISAGNSGPGKQTVGSPSVARLSLSVGAAATRGMIERQYQWAGLGSSTGGIDDPFMLFFSSRGPTASGGFKPNLVAPGTELSAIQMNAANAASAGLDVYWGTSMSAPTATGAYALLLDAIKKYNVKFPTTPLETRATVLRQILIDTAKTFDAKTFNPETGVKTEGQYTWIDQGTGMLNLPVAFKRILELQKNKLPTAVNLNGNPIELDYDILVSTVAPNGISYNGSRSAGEKTPAFGAGLYLDTKDQDTLAKVYINRHLPDSVSTSPEAAELKRQLVTTADEFMLKTVIYGSDKQWIKAGVLETPDCQNSPTQNLVIVSDGAKLEIEDDGTGKIIARNSSTLNVCINREMIANELPAGDNGALIYAYRVVNGQTAKFPSFVVPVYLTVPHKTLKGSTAYNIEKSVKSFGLDRNYIMVPEGTSIMNVTLEVPSRKAGEPCSGVELMSYEGSNVAKSFKSRTEARVSNCSDSGATSEGTRKLYFSRSNPTPGMWDIHVFGSYKFLESKYKLHIDYITATTNKDIIEGLPDDLSGSLEWTVSEATISVQPDAQKSSFIINGLSSSFSGAVETGSSVIVPNDQGDMRSYDANARSVTITTGESDGNDIDLAIYECPVGTTSLNFLCRPVAKSGGADANESATFTPRTDRVYAVQVVGYDVPKNGAFMSKEIITYADEIGKLTITGSAPTFTVEYAFSPEQLATSKLLMNPLVVYNNYSVTGSLTVRMQDNTALTVIPVEISAP